MKILGVLVSVKIFENCIFKTYFVTPWPTHATNQNHLNNFGRGPPRTIPIEFGLILISGSREEVVWRFPCIIKCKIVTPEAGSIFTQGYNLSWTTLVEVLLMMLYTKYEYSGPCSFRQEEVFKIAFWKPIFDPVTYLCKQLERLEHIW